ncbi:MAG: hypothetical protein WBP93_21785 [Pyrinomonadaceae bacterium]
MKTFTHSIAATNTSAPFETRPGERGSALTLSLLIMALLGVITMSVLAVVRTETRIAGSDLCRTQTFYAAQSRIEQMTNDFSSLFSKTSNPTPAQLDIIAGNNPQALLDEGFQFAPQPSIALDQGRLTAMQLTQNITNGGYPRVVIPSGAYSGLTATIAPYVLKATAKTDRCGAEVELQREINNYLIPLFQFGVFAEKDLEVYPGPPFTFNGRVHANGNIYVQGDVKFLSKVTTANEFVRDIQRNGLNYPGGLVNSVHMDVGGTDVEITQGSVTGGPNFTGTVDGDRGFFPTSPNGTANGNWESTSVAAAQASTPNQLGGQLLTRTTGATALLLPLQLGGNSTREIVKRRMPNDDQVLSESRYHSKAQIRILIDDEGVTNDASGIASAKGVNLSSFNPVPLGTGKALLRVNTNGTYKDTLPFIQQKQNLLPIDLTNVATYQTAQTVRSARNATVTDASGNVIPRGAGLSGHIYIELIKPDGTSVDVTSTVLSMGMTEGEPNGIVYLQRPVWATYLQGSRDRAGSTTANKIPYNLVSLINNTRWAADGEINTGYLLEETGVTAGVLGYGYMTDGQDDDDITDVDLTKTTLAGIAKRDYQPSSSRNDIIPINVYNQREGWISDAMTLNSVYERGITSVVEINMRNLTRWLDGVYDSNLLNGTTAVSTNIGDSNGYIVYVSDRRGDGRRNEKDSTNATLMTSNGMVDNEDIYGSNGTLDPGEDVIDSGTDMATGNSKGGTLQKYTSELPDVGSIWTGSTMAEREARADAVTRWTNGSNYFRRAVRLFDGEDLMPLGTTGKLSNTKGLTVAAENMVYVWGNYNTTGITCQPAGGSTLNDPTQTCNYQGDQVPASIVADAFYPLSKTWFDGSSTIYPEGNWLRPADANSSAVSDETSVRAGIIAGTALSALDGDPKASDSYPRLNGGVHNYPRFSEYWANKRWNFAGSFILLYNSTQSISPFHVQGNYVYYPPIRNWAFDDTFRNPARLPPGTPAFQYIEATAFRQVL